ncbi:hypothetical protein FUT79_09240 [Treponema phagedenis]|uniref:hypothetical protein n=1 Tax=Treponema phagedenis TaxID=162 RepID=UPI0011E70500|nr:hypothetical protein [Treponema phagedenis]QEJ95369.1 hypothetical protein FUT79_09240 [Treponema phagedenis]
MKEIRKAIQTDFFHIPFLVFLLFLVILACSVAAAASAKLFLSEGIAHGGRLLFFFVLTPLILIIAAIVIFFVLMSSAKKKKSKLRAKLFIIVFFISFFQAVLVTLIASFFITAPINEFFTSEFENSAFAANEILNLYTKERIAEVERICDRYFTGLNLSHFLQLNKNYLKEMRIIDGGAAAYQLFEIKDDLLRLLKASGDSALFLSIEECKLAKTETAIKTLSDEKSVIRAVRYISYGRKKYLAVYTSTMPDSFFKNAEQIKSLHTQVLRAETIKEIIAGIPIRILILFILPIILFSSLVYYKIIIFIDEYHSTLIASVSALAEGHPALYITKQNFLCAEVSDSIHNLIKTMREEK